MFSAQSLLAGNGASVTCLRESREPITTLNVATYVTPLVVQNFWLCGNLSQNYISDPDLRAVLANAELDDNKMMDFEDQELLLATSVI